MAYTVKSRHTKAEFKHLQQKKPIFSVHSLYMFGMLVSFSCGVAAMEAVPEANAGPVFVESPEVCSAESRVLSEILGADGIEQTLKSVSVIEGLMDKTPHRFKKLTPDKEEVQKPKRKPKFLTEMAARDPALVEAGL